MHPGRSGSECHAAVRGERGPAGRRPTGPVWPGWHWGVRFLSADVGHRHSRSPTARELPAARVASPVRRSDPDSGSVQRSVARDGTTAAAGQHGQRTARRLPGGQPRATRHTGAPRRNPVPHRSQRRLQTTTSLGSPGVATGASSSGAPSTYLCWAPTAGWRSSSTEWRRPPSSSPPGAGQGAQFVLLPPRCTRPRTVRSDHRDRPDLHRRGPYECRDPPSRRDGDDVAVECSSHCLGFRHARLCLHRGRDRCGLGWTADLV